MLELGVTLLVRCFEWVTKLVFVWKKHGNIHLYVNFKALNKVSIKNIVCNFAINVIYEVMFLHDDFWYN
jgi:hypothetical protein